MSRYKAYPEYRDSQTKWLGAIPNDWNIFDGKRLFSSRRESAHEGDEQLAASQKYGVVPQSLMMEMNDAKVMLALKGTSSFRHVGANDFVISLRSFEGGIEHSIYAGCVSPAYTVLQAEKAVVPAYFKYLLKSGPYIAALQASTDSLRDGKSISFEQFGAIALPYPTGDEQAAIAAFLDHETAKIDALIEKQQRLIELLKEKRQAVISHAVIRGLNPNAPMKDSGVEWLGEVPAHWDVHAIKHIVSTPITDGPHETPDFFDAGIPFVSAEAVSSGRIDFEKIRAHISDADNQRFSKKYSPKKFDIYMVKSGATTGVTAIVETDDVFNIWSPLAAIRCNELNYPYFVLNFMRSRNFSDAIAISWSFGTQQNIGMKVIENLPITRPPLFEAIEIAKYLQEKCAKFDKIILQALAQIELMQERRTALISAAVTGKIDVRDWQAAA